jgi:hypothetical protein
MPIASLSPNTRSAVPHLPSATCQRNRENARVSHLARNTTSASRTAGRPAARILIRPQPGFYVMRLRSGAPLAPAIIYQLCPMVIPQPSTATGPHPDEWCRPLDRSPRYAAQVDGKRVAIDQVWTARSLRRVNRDEYQFRTGPLRRWALQNPGAPEARPARPVDLDAIPSLF